MTIFLRRAVSTKTNRVYAALMVELGYKQLSLTFNEQTIAEVLGISVAQLVALPQGDIELGKISLPAKK